MNRKSNLADIYDYREKHFSGTNSVSEADGSSNSKKFCGWVLECIRKSVARRLRLHLPSILPWWDCITSTVSSFGLSSSRKKRSYCTESTEDLLLHLYLGSKSVNIFNQSFCHLLFNTGGVFLLKKWRILNFSKFLIFKDYVLETQCE